MEPTEVKRESTHPIDTRESINPFQGIKPDEQGIYQSVQYPYEEIGHFTFFASSDLESETVSPLESNPLRLWVEFIPSKPLTPDNATAINAQLLISLVGRIPNIGQSFANASEFEVDRQTQMITKMIYKDWSPAQTQNRVKDSGKKPKDNIVRIHKLREAVVKNPLIVSQSNLADTEFIFTNIIKS